MKNMIKTNTKGLFRKPGGGFVIDRVINGERIYRTLKNIPLQLAQQIVDKLIAEIVEAQYFPEKAQRYLTLKECMNFYWDERLQHKKSAYDSKFLVRTVIEHFGEKLVQKMNIRDVEAFKVKRLSTISRYDRPMSANAVNHELDILNVAINWAVKTKRLQSNPITGFEKCREAAPKKVVIDDGYANGKQWRGLYGAADKDLKPILMTLYETGMRPAEVFGMRWEWITEADIDKWLIEIPQDQEKTGAERKIPVSKSLLEILRPMRKESGLVFPSPVTGKERLTITRSFSAARKKTNLKKEITPMALRRTRITIWSNVDSEACRHIVGHKPRDCHFKHYLRFTKDRLFKIVGL
jgi:integrase